MRQLLTDRLKHDKIKNRVKALFFNIFLNFEKGNCTKETFSAMIVGVSEVFTLGLRRVRDEELHESEEWRR